MICVGALKVVKEQSVIEMLYELCKIEPCKGVIVYYESYLC